MKQGQYSPLTVAEMALSMFAVDQGFFDDVPVDKIRKVEKELHSYCRTNHATLMTTINNEGVYNDDIKVEMKSAVENCLANINL